MNFAVYLPPKAEDANAKLPVIYWLSGLTCNEQNFIQKAGGQKLAANHEFIMVCPDTSPSKCLIFWFHIVVKCVITYDHRGM